MKAGSRMIWELQIASFHSLQHIGTSANAEAAFFANEFDRRRMFLACIIPGKRIAIATYLCYCSEKWRRSQMKTEKGEDSKDLISEDLKT